MAAPNKNPQQRRSYAVAFHIPSQTATAALKIFKARKRMMIDGVDLIPFTTLATDGTNYFTGTIKNGSNTPVSALINTNAAGGAALTANTVYNGTNGTKAARTIAAGDQVTLDLVEAATATLPACTLVLWVTELS